jgi:hypothetical protein
LRDDRNWATGGMLNIAAGVFLNNQDDIVITASNLQLTIFNTTPTLSTTYQTLTHSTKLSSLAPNSSLFPPQMLTVFQQTVTEDFRDFTLFFRFVRFFFNIFYFSNLGQCETARRRFSLKDIS